MAALIPNISKGRFARYCDLPLTNDAVYWVLFTGVETDANIRDTDNLTTSIALVLNEATFTGYSRQLAVGVTVTTDDTNDRVDVDITTDPSWSPTTAEALTRIGAYYEPDTTAAADANKIPLFVDDFALTTPLSGTVTYVVATGGFGRAS